MNYLCEEYLLRQSVNLRISHGEPAVIVVQVKGMQQMQGTRKQSTMQESELWKGHKETLSLFKASFQLEYLLLSYLWPPLHHPCSQLIIVSPLIHATAWSYYNETRFSKWKITANRTLQNLDYCCMLKDSSYGSTVHVS